MKLVTGRDPKEKQSNCQCKDCVREFKGWVKSCITCCDGLKKGGVFMSNYLHKDTFK